MSKKEHTLLENILNISCTIEEGISKSNKKTNINTFKSDLFKVGAGGLAGWALGRSGSHNLPDDVADAIDDNTEAINSLREKLEDMNSSNY